MRKAHFIYRNREMPGCRVVNFGDALRAAWSWFKRATRPPVVVTRTIELRSMIGSPIRRSLTGPYASDRARSAGYVTSMMGR
ncbi:hypothetical protein [Phenylobacterium sp.]|uniref:hypothetical protein n=1 Tax=Phenylobacterium sp. TaxID=1871053 RepID=UPI0025DAA53A|nr:hypothetical protein [Phenylobacterium sp.]